MLKTYWEIKRGSDNYIIILILLLLQPKNFLTYPFIPIIEKLDTKQHKIPFLRDFFLYVLEIIENATNYGILITNFQLSFWRKLKTILQQNEKAVLLEFLFGKAKLNQDQILGLIPHLQDQMKALNNQVDSLHQKIIELENHQRLTIKSAIRHLLKR